MQILCFHNHLEPCICRALTVRNVLKEHKIISSFISTLLKPEFQVLQFYCWNVITTHNGGSSIEMPQVLGCTALTGIKNNPKGWSGSPQIQRPQTCRRIVTDSPWMQMNNHDYRVLLQQKKKHQRHFQEDLSLLFHFQKAKQWRQLEVTSDLRLRGFPHTNRGMLQCFSVAALKKIINHHRKPSRHGEIMLPGGAAVTRAAAPFVAAAQELHGAHEAINCAGPP